MARCFHGQSDHRKRTGPYWRMDCAKAAQTNKKIKEHIYRSIKHAKRKCSNGVIPSFKNQTLFLFSHKIMAIHVEWRFISLFFDIVKNSTSWLGLQLKKSLGDSITLRYGTVPLTKTPSSVCIFWCIITVRIPLQTVHCVSTGHEIGLKVSKIESGF